MNFRKERKRKRKNILGVIIILIIIFFIIKLKLFDDNLSLHTTVVFKSGDSIQNIYKELDASQTRSLRWYLYNNKDILDAIQQGSYIFSGNYTPLQLIEQLNSGPDRTYDVVTLLEGWSIYDIDSYLTKKGYILDGEYISYVSNPSHIQSIANKYPFVQKFIDTKSAIAPAVITLEGLLYPDTYHIDPNQNVLDQLVSLQLKAFQTKVFLPYQNQIDDFSSKLQSHGFTFSMRWYNIVTLASIVEKEERLTKNKPTIAGIFLNRIQSGMRIDADITLCYGLYMGYEICTPSLIVKSLKDNSNLYNTRVHTGLTPGPIANPSVGSFQSVLNFTSTKYYYYLHGSDGSIHYGETLAEHNANKRYL